MSSWTTEVANGAIGITENPAGEPGLTKREAWITAVALATNRGLADVTVVFLTGEVKIVTVTEQDRADLVANMLGGPSPYSQMRKPRRYVYEGVTRADGTVVLDARLNTPTDWRAMHPDAKPMPWERASVY